MDCNRCLTFLDQHRQLFKKRIVMDCHSLVLNLQKLNTEQRPAHVALLAANGKNGHRGLQAVVLERACVVS